jgi:SAM-dependent methyltransferase
MQIPIHAGESLRAYHDQRAAEYEAVYNRDEPVRQAELRELGEALRQATAGRRVLEVACGTGFWTSQIAEEAEHVTAIDTSEEMLLHAQDKGLPGDKVEFRLGDAYRLEATPGRFDAGVLNFWLSHVPQALLHEFLRRFHERLCSGATVFIADNVCLPGAGGELLRGPGSPDTFKRRTLADGSEHHVLKNYYDARQLRELIERHATGLEIHTGSCYWWSTYEIACPAGLARRLTDFGDYEAD